MKIDWKLIRSEYEIMHTDVKELSQRHHVPESMIVFAISEGKWERQDIDQEDIQRVSDKLAAMHAANDMSLVPKFIQLQGKLLDKCDKLLDDCKEINDAKNLQIVAEIVEKHRPAVLGNKGDKSVGAGQTTVRILTQVGSGAETSIAAVEISPSAGESNGVGRVLVN